MGTANSLKLRSLLTGLALLLALLPSLSGAHPYHTAFAELGWSSSGESLEVSLRLLPEDLETALSWQAGATVVLRDSPEVKAQVERYLQKHFQVFAERGPARPVKLAGMEIAYDETWIYFTVSASSKSNLSLRNTVLLEVSSTQTNRVQRLWATPADTLVMSRERPEVSFWQAG